MRGQRARWVAGAVAVAVPLVPIVIGATISSSPGGARASSDLTFKSAPAPKPARPAPHQSGTLVALVKRTTTMRRAPGGGFLARLPTKTEFGSPEALWVVSQHGPWLGVISPLAGNGKVGWIPRSVTTLGRVTWELKVSLGARRLTVLDNGHPLRRYKVAIGRPGAPTPTGRFAVTDRLSTGDPSGPYGCCILALSAHSPHAIQGWDGGDRIAIHSTPETSSIGEAVSHGCLRLTLAEGRWLLGHVPLGTPTLISA
jgi:lipoprotein-anchoring transpeptidase ErfK/SrfK